MREESEERDVCACGGRRVRRGTCSCGGRRVRDVCACGGRRVRDVCACGGRSVRDVFMWREESEGRDVCGGDDDIEMMLMVSFS